METRRILNKEFKIVFTPKTSEIHPKRRFAIGAGTIDKYIGESNAQVAARRALESMDDKCTVKFRKFGKLEFYRK